MSIIKTIYWRNPDKNYAFERIGEVRMGYMVFFDIDDGIFSRLAGGLYTMGKENRLGKK